MDDAPEPGSNAHEFTVSELSGAVKRSIEDQFGRVRVRAEVGRVSRPGSGHLYFDLKDDRAVLAAVTWKGQAARLIQRPEEGMEVIATGRLTTFPGQSKYQMIVDRDRARRCGRADGDAGEAPQGRWRPRGCSIRTASAPLPFLPRGDRGGDLALRCGDPRHPAPAARPLSDPRDHLAGGRAGRGLRAAGRRPRSGASTRCRRAGRSRGRT